MNSKGTAGFGLAGMMSFVEVGVVVDDVVAEEAENVMVDFYGEVAPGWHIRLGIVEDVSLFWTNMIREGCGKVPCERESIGLVGRGFRLQGLPYLALVKVNWRDILRSTTCSFHS
jgi:hypothetical protein